MSAFVGLEQVEDHLAVQLIGQSLDAQAGLMQHFHAFGGAAAGHACFVDG
jgi:hypothetical protein